MERRMAVRLRRATTGDYHEALPHLRSLGGVHSTEFLELPNTWTMERTG